MKSEQGSAALNQDACLHCFCKQDSGGVLYCCKCNKRLNVGTVTVYPSRHFFTPPTTYFTPLVFPLMTLPSIQQEYVWPNH